MSDDRLNKLVGEFRKAGEARDAAAQRGRAKAEAERKRKATLDELWRKQAQLLRSEVAAVNTALEGTGYKVEFKPMSTEYGAKFIGGMTFSMVGDQTRGMRASSSVVLENNGELRFQLREAGSKKPQAKIVLASAMTAEIWREWVLDFLEAWKQGSGE